MYFAFQRLADIAITLLKVSPYDPETMGCRGLQRYMSHLLPATDWSNETMKQTLLTMLRRVDKMFVKIYKKSSIRVKISLIHTNNFARNAPQPSRDPFTLLIFF